MGDRQPLAADHPQRHHRSHDPNPVVRRRRVAIASLMWGYGITGTRWGSWVTDISDFLSPGLDLVLADCETHLTAGRIAKAYERFAHPGPGGIGFHSGLSSSAAR